jgi:arylsulfatase A-like enzyme
MNGVPRRALAAAWLLALSTFGAVFLTVSHRSPAPPQRIVHLIDELRTPQARFACSAETPEGSEAVATLERSSLGAGLGGFLLVDEQARLADAQAAENAAWAPRPVAAANGDPALLRFPTARGGLVRVVRVDAGRLLSIRARVRRAKNPAPIDDARVEALQGVLVVRALQREIDLARELESKSLVALLADPTRVDPGTRCVSPTAKGDGRWTTLDVGIHVPPRTVALVVQIGAGNGATGVPFDVDEVVVEEMTLRRFAGVGGLRDEPGRATLPPRDDWGLPLLPPADPARPLVRSVDDLLERRDALVLPPPARATFEADLPDGDVALEYGVARVHEFRSAFARERVVVDVEVAPLDGGRALTQSTALEAGGPDGWQERALGLSSLAGRRVRFTFTTGATRAAQRPGGGACDDVVAIGAPLVRRRSPDDPRLNVVLFSIDTVRDDHLSCAGYPRPTTPWLDRLARESAWFRDAASTSSYTLPAHASMLTGQLPSRHGAESEAAGRDHVWLDRSDLVAARLREAGWQTAAFTGGVYLSAKFGLDQGFDRYDAVDLALERRAGRYESDPAIGQPAFNRAYRRQRTFGHALDWIRGHSDGPFFLFLHTYLVHEYLPAARHEARFHGACASALADEKQEFLRDRNSKARPTAADVDHFVDLYDAALCEADELVGRLMTTLRETGELEQTVVVVVSDHGEEFLDHGLLAHGRTLYDEVLRVPLIVRAPGRRAVEVRTPVSLCDVAPTLLELCGVAPRHEMDGRSLVPLIDGETPAGAPPQLAELNLDRGSRWIARRERGLAALDVRDQRGDERLAREHAIRRPPQRNLFAPRCDAEETVDLAAAPPSDAASELIDLLDGQRGEMEQRRKASFRKGAKVPALGYFEPEEEDE